MSDYSFETRGYDPCEVERAKVRASAKLKAESSAQHLPPRPLSNAGQDLGMET